MKCFLGLTTLDRSHKLGWLKLLDNRGFTLFSYIVRICRWPFLYSCDMFQIRMIRVVQSTELRLFSVGAKCEFKSKSLQSKIVFLWSQRGRVVSASDLQSGCSGFESNCGHLLDLLLLAPSSNLGHACKYLLSVAFFNPVTFYLDYLSGVIVNYLDKLRPHPTINKL